MRCMCRLGCSLKLILALQPTSCHVSPTHPLFMPHGFRTCRACSRLGSTRRGPPPRGGRGDKWGRRRPMPPRITSTMVRTVLIICVEHPILCLKCCERTVPPDCLAYHTSCARLPLTNPNGARKLPKYALHHTTAPPAHRQRTLPIRSGRGLASCPLPHIMKQLFHNPLHRFGGGECNKNLPVGARHGTSNPPHLRRLGTKDQSLSLVQPLNLILFALRISCLSMACSKLTSFCCLTASIWSALARSRDLLNLEAGGIVRERDFWPC